MTITTPTLLGNPPTASKQELRFSTAMSSPSADPTIAHDMVQLATHAQAWLVLLNPDQTMGCVPVKFAGYDCEIDDYSRFRRSMKGSSAARLISKWASPVGSNDPAYTAVRKFCGRYGITPREEFRVLVAKNVAAPAAPSSPAQDKAVADLIVAVLPYLAAAERARVAEAARH